MTRKRRPGERLKDAATEPLPLFWLLLFVAALVIFYGAKAPAILLAVLFRYFLMLFLLLVTGLAGRSPSPELRANQNSA